MRGEWKAHASCWRCPGRRVKKGIPAIRDRLYEQGSSYVCHIVIEAEAGMKRGLPVAEYVPGEADTRFKIPLVTGVLERLALAEPSRWIRKVEIPALQTMDLIGRSVELIAKAEVYRQSRCKSPVILHIEPVGVVQPVAADISASDVHALRIGRRKIRVVYPLHVAGEAGKDEVTCVNILLVDLPHA